MTKFTMFRPLSEAPRDGTRIFLATRDFSVVGPGSFVRALAWTGWLFDGAGWPNRDVTQWMPYYEGSRLTTHKRAWWAFWRPKYTPMLTAGPFVYASYVGIADIRKPTTQPVDE